MSQRPVVNQPASVRQRLQNLAEAQGRPFAELLQYYAMERFLHRLTTAVPGDRFVLKGALLFMAWALPGGRTTRDIDLLARPGSGPEAVAPAMREACRQPVAPDGLEFDASTVTADPAMIEAEYPGVRVRCTGCLGSATVHLQLDIAFGDALLPAPSLVELPSLLGAPPPRLYAYAPESVLAEKLETMVKFGELNSRLKDFFDAWLLAHSLDFEGPVLAGAIAATFARRRRTVPAQPTSLLPAFGANRRRQAAWRAFLGRSRLHAPGDFGQVVATISDFFSPVTAAVAAGAAFEQSWQAPGPWRPKGSS